MAKKNKVLVNLFSVQQKLQIYCEVVAQNLKYTPPIRKQFMKMLKADIADYLEANPDATMNDICVEFGDPFEQENEIFTEIERDYYRKLRKRMVVCYILLAVLLFLLLLAVAFATHLFFITDPVLRLSNIDTKYSFVDF